MGNLEGRAAISSPPIIVSGSDATITGLVGNFVALKALNYNNAAENSRIVFASNRTGTYQIYIMSADGKDVQQVTNEAGAASHPALSPDGTKIVYQLQGGQSDIFMINVDGTGRTALTNTAAASERQPVWNGTGTKVAYRRFDGGTVDIWTTDVATKVASKISSFGGALDVSWDRQSGFLFFQNDGTDEWLILYLDGTFNTTPSPVTASRVKSGPFSHSVMFADSGKLSAGTIGNLATFVGSGVLDIGGFSPDGKFGLFSRWEEASNVQLSTVNFASGSVTRITNDLESYIDPDWGPAPRSTTLIGTSTALGLNASGFLFGQQGPSIESALAFKAVTQSTVVVATDPTQNQGPNIVYTIDADNLTALSYANGPFFRPTRVIGGGAEVGNADGAIVSFDTATGKVTNVLAFVGTRSGRPTVSREGDRLVIRGELVGVVSDGKQLGRASVVSIDANGKATIRS